MKRFIAIAACMSLAACGRPLEHNGKTYPTYGLINQSSSQSKDMCYEVSVGNVVWSIVLIETIAAPIYFLGFSVMNPVGPKDANGNCGVDAGR